MQNLFLLPKVEKPLTPLKKKFEEAGCLCSLTRNAEITTLFINSRNVSSETIIDKATSKMFP